MRSARPSVGVVLLSDAPFHRPWWRECGREGFFFFFSSLLLLSCPASLAIRSPNHYYRLTRVAAPRAWLSCDDGFSPSRLARARDADLPAAWRALAPQRSLWSANDKAVSVKYPYRTIDHQGPPPFWDNWEVRGVPQISPPYVIKWKGGRAGRGRWIQFGNGTFPITQRKTQYTVTYRYTSRVRI
ncbi:hypothetical protein LX36DRAFT_477471 [Colletotrichum falcatum]|nr:hypothetical protein LX36DRAFT_477471 [Colletotrichum falcatum]